MFSDFDAALPEVAVQRALGDAQPFGDVVHLSDVESACASLVGKNHNQFQTMADDPHARLFTDDLKLRQILLNLIGNAAKFTKDGKVELKVTGIDLGGTRHTRFEVADTGIGMTQQQLDGLFERFSQADSSTTRN